MLTAARIPVPVAGCLTWDPPAAAALQTGELTRAGRSPRADRLGPVGGAGAVRAVAGAVRGRGTAARADAHPGRGWPGEPAASEPRSGPTSRRPWPRCPRDAAAPAARSGIWVRSGEGYR